MTKYRSIFIRYRIMYHIHNMSLHACRFGPLQNTWCMRFESKNKEMKHYVTNCYKNVPYSVSVRH